MAPGDVYRANASADTTLLSIYVAPVNDAPVVSIPSVQIVSDSLLTGDQLSALVTELRPIYTHENEQIVLPEMLIRDVDNLNEQFFVRVNLSARHGTLRLDWNTERSQFYRTHASGVAVLSGCFTGECAEVVFMAPLATVNQLFSAGGPMPRVEERDRLSLFTFIPTAFYSGIFASVTITVDDLGL
eukprot:gene24914-biopygen9616